VPACVRIRGPLSIGALKKSFQLVVDRHEALRTTFAELDGEVVQIVADTIPASFSVSRLSMAAEHDRTGRVAHPIREEALRRFDLVSGSLARARLFSVQPDEHILAVTLHHSVADALSQRVLQRELWAAYEALLDGGEPELPPLVIQYADFAASQIDWLESAEMRASLRYWEQTLAGVSFWTSPPRIPLSARRCRASPCGRWRCRTT